MIRSTPSSYAAAARADAWAAQLTWYLDSTAGNDTNDGAALASPIKTIAELQRRLPFKRKVWYTVNVIGQFTEGHVELAGNADYRGIIAFVGSRTQQATGSVTATTAYDAATKADGTITDSAKANDFWAPHVARMIVLTSGANIGAWAFVTKSFAGTKKCRHGMFWDNVNFVVVHPAVADTFAIYELQEWTGASNGGGQLLALNGGAYYWKDFRFTASSTGINVNPGTYAVFEGCSFPPPLYGIDVYAGAAFFDAIACYHASRLRTGNGGGNVSLENPTCAQNANAQILAHSGGQWTVYSGGLLQDGCRVHATGDGRVVVETDLACFDSPNLAVLASRGGTVQLNGKVYGTGLTGVLVRIDAGSRVLFDTTAKLPDIDTPSTYATISGTPKTRAEMLAASFMHSTTGAVFALDD